MLYTSTDLGVDSSSRIPFRARTHRHTESQTQLIALATTRQHCALTFDVDGVELRWREVT